jgi:hypothetical protein
VEEIRVCGWAELYEQLFADARHPKLGRIDSTYSPFVALHFATARMEAFGRDGLVWMVDYVPAQERRRRRSPRCCRGRG